MVKFIFIFNFGKNFQCGNFVLKRACVVKIVLSQNSLMNGVFLFAENCIAIDSQNQLLHSKDIHFDSFNSGLIWKNGKLRKQISHDVKMNEFLLWQMYSHQYCKKHWRWQIRNWPWVGQSLLTCERIYLNMTSSHVSAWLTRFLLSHAATWLMPRSCDYSVHSIKSLSRPLNSPSFPLSSIIIRAL